MKKFLVSAVSFIIGTALAVTGTFAYVRSETQLFNKNTITEGDVDIVQLEYQRVQSGEPAVHSWGGVGFKPLEQGTELFPSAAEADGEINTVLEAAGVQDKFVFVKNNGVKSVYVRTYIAFESGNLSREEFKNAVGYCINTVDYDWDETLPEVTYGGEQYYVLTATAKATVAPDAVSAPSLLQFYLKEYTSEAVGNRFGGDFKVIAVSDASDSAFTERPDQAGYDAIFQSAAAIVANK